MNDSMFSPPSDHVGGGRADRFVRKLFRMLRSRTQRHNQHLWPFVRIWRDKDGAISAYRAFGRSLRITPLSQGYDPADKVVHLILSGPSISEIPYDRMNIGVAMGVTGTDVAKEAAAMILTDDNFASIVAAVEEGRGVFANIKKYLMYLLAANLGEIGLLLGASLLGKPLPLSAVQILYVNLATDGLPALALSVDPAERDLMRRVAESDATAR